MKTAPGVVFAAPCTQDTGFSRSAKSLLKAAESVPTALIGPREGP